jgi:predicted MFS family arabinose efflux permease
MLFLGMAVFSMFFFLTLYLQNIHHFSAVRTGLGFLPMSFGIMFAAILTSRLLARVGIRIPLITGPVFALAGLIWLTQLSPSTSYGMILAPLILLALGMGQCFVPLTVTAVSGVAPEEAGIASALVNTGQQVGGALGLAVLGTVAISSARHYATSAIHSGAHVSTALVNAAQVHGDTSAFKVASAMMGVALLISLVAIRAPKAVITTYGPSGGTGEGTVGPGGATPAEPVVTAG